MIGKKRGNPPPNDEQIRLQVSAEEARNWLDERIAKGKLLLEARETLGPDEFRAQEDAWDGYNRTLINKKLFGSEAAASEVYDLYSSVATVAINPTAWEQAASSAKDIKRKIDQLASLKEQLELYAGTGPPANAKIPAVSAGAVFLVHGHDLGALGTVREYVRGLDLEVRVLSEQPDGGTLTITEKLVRESSGVGYAVAVVTPDDEARNDQRRARQNVIFELGYFIGMLGREKVKVLKKGHVEWFSDLDGALYIEVDDAGEWMKRLRIELRVAGMLGD